MKVEGPGRTRAVVDVALSTPLTAMTSDDVETWYLRYGAELRQALRRLAPDLDADDLLQEAFVIALKTPDKLARAESPRAWLYGICIKLAATRRRTLRLRSFFGLDAAERQSSPERLSTRLEQRDAQRAVARAVESLSPAKQQAFVLFELQGLSGDEVASALDVPVKTVWTRLHHARREVTEALERQLLQEARTSGLRREELEP